MKKYSLGIILAFLVSCVDDFNHQEIDTTIVSPDLSGKTEITFSQLYNLHSKEIGKDTLVTGYVVSSDQQGNFYKEIFVQNTLGAEDIADENPRMGIRIRVGLTKTSTKYAKGRKVAINLEGLKKTTSDDLLTLGKPSGNYIKDILEFELDDYIYKIDEIGETIPKPVTLSELTTNDLNTMVKIEDVHFKVSQIGMPFAGLSTDDFDGKRTLEYCRGFRNDTILLETSNFADFASKEIPNTQLNITAIYNISFDNEPILVLNKFIDIEETGAYVNCNTKTPNVLITEIADPENAAFSRYVELYNHEDVAVVLDDWNLNRYVNGGTEQKIPLDGLFIAAKGFIIIANDEVSSTTNFNFQDSFGFMSDSVHSKLDGNGDDAYALTNESGNVIDIYGDTTKDGTGSVWEYEDGRVYRNIDIIKPNTVFTIEEWSIFKDGQNAPNDFNPRVR